MNILGALVGYNSALRALNSQDMVLVVEVRIGWVHMKSLDIEVVLQEGACHDRKREKWVVAHMKEVAQWYLGQLDTKAGGLMVLVVVEHYNIVLVEDPYLAEGPCLGEALLDLMEGECYAGRD